MGRPTPDLLATLFAGAESLIPFATAVSEHLGLNADGPEREAILGEVAEILQQALDPGEDPPVERLAANPVLLASFFQNTDLLHPSAPETGLVARLVMAAVERLDDGVA